MALVRHEAAMVEQQGPSATSLQLGNISVGVSEKNASRHVERVTKRFNLSLNLPLSTHSYTENSSTVEIPFLKPSTILQKLLQEYPFALLGGCMPGGEAETLLTTFWEAYREDHPSHQVFSLPGRRLKRTIPVLLHGDSGRTQKKQPLDVVSIEPVLGLNTSLKEACKCRCPHAVKSEALDMTNPLAIKLNSRHSSFLTKYLLYAYPVKKYKHYPGLCLSMHSTISEDLAQVCRHGLYAHQARWYTAILGYKADWEYHVKVGSLERSFLKVGCTQEYMICHECHAGAADCPFEDCGTRAAWTSTMYQTLPWRDTPAFRSLPFEPWDRPSRAPMFFRRDPFHSFRLGTLAAIISTFFGCLVWWVYWWVINLCTHIDELI